DFYTHQWIELLGDDDVRYFKPAVIVPGQIVDVFHRIRFIIAICPKRIDVEIGLIPMSQSKIGKEYTENRKYIESNITQLPVWLGGHFHKFQGRTHRIIIGIRCQECRDQHFGLISTIPKVVVSSIFRMRSSVSQTTGNYFPVVFKSSEQILHVSRVVSHKSIKREE